MIVKITTTTKVQRAIKEISKNVQSNPYIATQRGEPRMVLLPYFDKAGELIADYMEEYELHQNKEKLEKELEESMNSGISDLKI